MVASVERKVQRGYAPFRRCRELCRPAPPASRVLRIWPRGSRASVTWAEFVEAGLLRAYRRPHRIPMGELRAFIDQMRQKLGVPYPLAHQRPYASGKDLLAEAQDVAGLDADLCLVAVVRGQYVLTPAADSF